MALIRGGMPIIKNNFQNTSGPDIDLERDIIEIEELLGMEATEISSEKRDSRMVVNLSTIIISALIFLTILSWFDLMQTVFYVWTYPQFISETVPPDVKFWYAILVTSIVLILVVLIYYHSRKHIT